MGEGTEFNTGIFIFFLYFFIFSLLSVLSLASPQTKICSKWSQQLPLRKLWRTSPKFLLVFCPPLIKYHISFPLYFSFILFIHLLLGLFGVWGFFFLLFVDGGIQGLHREMLCSIGMLVAGFKDFMLSTAAGLLYLAGTLPFSSIHLLYCKQNQWNWS